MEPAFPSIVRVSVGGVVLLGDLTIPPAPQGCVVLVTGTGTARLSQRSRYVAASFEQLGFATLVLDLLTRDEELAADPSHHRRFDIELLAGRLMGAIEWLGKQDRLSNAAIGLYGSSTGAAAALIAAAELPDTVAAVVSVGGRIDLAGRRLDDVRSPTLLVVGARDDHVLGINLGARTRLAGTSEVDVVRGAGHLFDEPGTLDEVVRAAGEWFHQHLTGEKRSMTEETHGLLQC